jgi:kynurenine formamidase
MQIVDISRPLRAGDDVICEVPEELPVYEGLACVEYRYAFRSHVGCHFETSAHLFRGGTMTDGVPVSRLLLPAVVARLGPTRTGGIRTEELGVAAGERLAAGHALIVDTGGRGGRYFERGCAAWMAERRVALLASSLDQYDTGFRHPTGIFTDLFRAEIPIRAGVQSLGAIEHELVFLIVLPLRIERVCTVPSRALVLDGEPQENGLLAGLLRPDLSPATGCRPLL